MDVENHRTCRFHRLLRLPEVLTLTGLSKSVLHDLVKKGRFPASVRISERAVAWWECEVRAWMEIPPTNAIAQRPEGISRPLSASWVSARPCQRVAARPRWILHRGRAGFRHCAPDSPTGTTRDGMPNLCPHQTIRPLVPAFGCRGFARFGITTVTSSSIWPGVGGTMMRRPSARFTRHSIQLSVPKRTTTTR